MKIFSAATSFFTGILIVVLYSMFNSIPLGFGLLFKVLPDSDIYISGKDIESILVYFVFSFIGLGLFFFARKNLEKKIRNLILYIMSALFIIGVQVLKILNDARVWNYEWNYYWDEGLKNLMLDMIPFTFLLLGFLILNGSRKAVIFLSVIFSSICLYHLLLSVGFLKVFGRAFSTVSRGDLTFTIIIIVCSLALALVNIMAFKQMNVHGNNGE